MSVAPEPQVAVAAALRAAIIRGDYAPRQRLVESELCEDFNTSRFIVRNALQELNADGLVEFQRNRGARVREVNPSADAGRGQVPAAGRR